LISVILDNNNPTNNKYETHLNNNIS